MRLRNLVLESLLSLTAHKTRSLLTMLGIIIGIAAVITMVALGNGTKASIEGSLQSIGSNLIMVSPGQGSSPVPGSAKPVAAQTLTIGDASAIAQEVTGIGAVAPQMQAALGVVAGSSNENVTVTGTSAGYPVVRNIELAQGRWFDEAEERSAARIAVLGASTSDKLFGAGSDPVGRKIRVGGVPFQVAGIAAAKGGAGTDDAVYVPLGTMRLSLAGGDRVGMIYVQAASEGDMPAVTQDIEILLLKRHHIGADEDADFSVTSMKDLTATMSSISGMLTALLGAIAGISLVVGGIGIMNMMLTSVTERTREIGLRKAVGARSADISAQFLLEATTLTVIGGLAGVVLGVGLCSLIALSGIIPAVVTYGSVLLAVGVSTVVGIGFGYYPARNAARLDPIEALRYQ